MRQSLCLIPAALVLFSWWQGTIYPDTAPGTGNENAAPQPAQDILPRPNDHFRLVGAGSCAAAACHNANLGHGRPGSEYATWVGQDPHGRAYAVLFNDLAAGMQRIRSSPKKAHEDQRCLDCHVFPKLDAEHANAAAHFRNDGVSCEACHGPAERWLSGHYTPAWKAQPDSLKEKQGMKNTRSLVGRARVCVDCHVGKPGMDVDHDLLAAGHPRLSFEFCAFHEAMPRHWPDARDRDPVRSSRGHVDFETRAWITGQLVAAQAALELLAHRADGTKKAIWPEFAEHDCFACHQDLSSPSRRQKEYARVGLQRTLPWNSWFEGSTLTVLRAIKADSQAIEDLTRMPRLDYSRDRDQVHRLASRAAKECAAALERLALGPFDAQQSNGLIREILARNAGSDVDKLNDDRTTRYLALAALVKTAQDERAPLPEALQQLLRALEFRRYDRVSPRITPAAVQRRVFQLESLVVPGARPRSDLPELLLPNNCFQPREKP